MTEKLEDFLLEKRRDNKDKMEKGIKGKYIGYWGELFSLNYLKKLFKRNNINCSIAPHKYDKEDYDLEIYINGRRYKIEIKFSTIEDYPVFNQIHFNNDFKYLLLIWHPSNDKIYFAILTKQEARKIATPVNRNREEDNWKIHTKKIFEETNKNFLKRLSTFLEINEELEDLEDEAKLELIENAKEQVIKTHKDAIRKDFSGITYQYWIYEYLSNFTNEVEPEPNDGDYDIKYKGRRIEVKYSAFIEKDFHFQFWQIKPENFEFILLIGFDKKENKFYFAIKTSDEILKIKRELAGTDKFYSQDGFTLGVGKHSILNFVNDFTFEDFDKYIETH